MKSSMTATYLLRRRGTGGIASSREREQSNLNKKLPRPRVAKSTLGNRFAADDRRARKRESEQEIPSHSKIEISMRHAYIWAAWNERSERGKRE
jgi:hypothetical protein